MTTKSTDLLPIRLVSPRLVALNLAAKTPAEAIRELTALLAGCPAVADLAQLERAIIERERMFSSQIGNVIAFPHARTKAVKDFVLVAGRSSAGIPFGLEARPAKLVLLLGSPDGRIQDHLAIISGLSRRLSDPDVQRRLLAAGLPEEFSRVLAEEP